MKLFELQSPAEVIELNNQLSHMFKTLGLRVHFSTHFVERLLGRERRVTIEEIVNAFAQLKARYKHRLLKAKKLGKYEGVIQDFSNELNIVFGIQGDQLNNITVMTKNPVNFGMDTHGGEVFRVG